MALHAASDLSPLQNPRFVFLLAPLVIITVFCFGYVSLQKHTTAQASAHPRQQQSAQSKPSEVPRQLLDEQQHLDPVPTAETDTSPVARQQASQSQADYGQAVSGQGASNASPVSNAPSAHAQQKNIAPVTRLVKSLLQL